MTKTSLQPIMIVGTCSNAGKSTIVTGLARLFAERGINVVPFKSQNMSLNSYATLSGEEIARSIAVQAFAARQTPSVHMNPILLKPNNDTDCQVIIHGKVDCPAGGKDYFLSEKWIVTKQQAILTSIEHLKKQSDLILVEGAGSCAEPNFRDNDLVNLGLAAILKAKVYLVVDIDRGGVFAEILGTLRVIELTSPQDRRLIHGIIINKFRGDRTILQPAIDFIVKETGIPVVGVVPYLHDLHLEEEDRLKEVECNAPEIDIVVIYLPHLSNNTDFMHLAAEENVRIRYVKCKEDLRSPDLIILPGTKNTLWDLEYIRKIGLEEGILNLLPTTPLMGICGGLEMLGKTLNDPYHIESKLNVLKGLGLFDFHVHFKRNKVVNQVCYRPSSKSIFQSAGEIHGYEIHNGELEYENSCDPLHSFEGITEGVIQTDPQLILGTFVHDIFKNPRFTRSLINLLRERKGLELLQTPLTDPERALDSQYNRLASEIEKSCSPLLEQIYSGH